MNNNFFTKAGDLDVNNSGYLQPAGDLESGAKSFRPAGDLESDAKSFQPAGDLGYKQNNSFNFNEKKDDFQSSEEVRNWLKTVVSGIKMSSENRPAIGGGKMMVSLEEFKRMVDSGDNIIKAEYIEGINCVDVEFETFGIPNRGR